MESAERLPTRIRRFAYQAIDDLILWKEIAGAERANGWRNGCAGVDLRVASWEDLSTLPKLRSRLEHSFCIVAVDQQTGIVAGYVWATNAPRLNEGVPPFTYQIHPKPNSLYIYDLRIDRRYRQFGLGSKVLRGVISEGAARGNDEAFYTIDRSSQPMVAMSASLGFKVVGSISYRCRLGMTQTNLADLEIVCKS
jgi:ribosomal protein S18 acetylase RimI-like enzyme